MVENTKYDLSIILPTLGRKVEVDTLLSTIFKYAKKLEYKIEIVIVDQNYSNLLDDIVSKYKNLTFPIKHYKVSFRGLSKAKNFGIEHSTGDILCFIDDDAEFIDGTIPYVFEIFNKDEKKDVVCGRMIDRNGNDSVGLFAKESSFLTLKSFEGKFIESSMFFKRHCFDEDKYDEGLGIGAFHGAEEGYDLVLRMLKKSVCFYYDPKITFYHPHTVFTHQTDGEVRRVFTYRCGYAKLCRKHSLRKKYYSRLFKVMLYIPYSAIFKNKQTRYYCSELLGLLAGKIIK